MRCTPMYFIKSANIFLILASACTTDTSTAPRARACCLVPTFLCRLYYMHSLAKTFFNRSNALNRSGDEVTASIPAIVTMSWLLVSWRNHRVSRNQQRGTMLAADYIETCTQICPLHSFERSLRASALGNTSSFVTLAAVAQKLFQCFSVSCSLRRTQSCRV